MLRVTVLCLLTFSLTISRAQNIFSALHLNETSEFKFGKPSQIIETNTFYSSRNTQIDKNVKTYDNAGILLEEDRYDDDGKLTAKLRYINDTTKRLKLQRIFERWARTGYSKETAVYTYDEHNFLIRVTDLNANGNTINVSQLVNNAKGNPTELRLYAGNGGAYGVEKAEYYYDENMVVTSVYSNDGGKLSTDTLAIDYSKAGPIDKSVYNDRGDAISYTSKNLDGSRHLFEEEYSYDDAGNCIDQKIYEVTIKKNGKKRRALDRRFQKQVIYRLE